MAIEEPKYTIIEKNDTYEIRKYAPYLVAQTEVHGAFDEMGRKAFRILFNYISGSNQQRSKIKMTAPVIQENSDKQGEKISMTAPVIQEMDKHDPQSAIISFVMPDNYKIDTLPLPLDKSIILKEVPEKTVAVLTYSGSWSKSQYKQNEAKLFQSLTEAGIKTIGKPLFARYNSPFSLWFLRRNEIMIEVNK
jgi:hypothetical protein